jgi:GTPase SAR1 family protein
MTEPSNPNAAASVRDDDLSIVLFGLPAAGKSSLLGALAQASQSQEHLLNGRLTDVSHGLDELRRRVYEESSRRTADEVVPYPVDFEPFSGDGGKPNTGQPVGAVVIDCDGRVANDLLVRRQAIADDSPEGTLAREVTDADTLVLVVDASAPPAQVESDFVEFDRFLRQMEISRGQRAEVGGLPVFLVLTKCDLLAQPADTAADWMERIEQHKRDLDARFRRLLARREEESGPLPFGRINLHLWATAVKRPALANAPAKAKEPYGVAELFRQCLEQAAAFRGRRRQSGRRLVWTVGAAAGVVALMASLAVGFTVHNLDTQTNALREQVQMLRSTDLPTEAERLRLPIRELRDRAKQWRAVRDHAQFGELSAEQQQLVRERLDEVDTYLGYYDRLVQSARLRDVHEEQELRAIKESLKTELALPRETWKDTEAGRLHAERLQDAEALDAAVKRARNWYRDNVDKADSLWTFSGQKTEAVDWDAWTGEVETLLRPDRRPPFNGADKLPGAATTLTYEATALRFEDVRKARMDWEASQARLRRLLDVSAALGLAPNVNNKPPVLVFPRNAPVTLRQVGERSKTLMEAYPNYQRDFVLDRLPQEIRAQARKKARGYYEQLLEPARAAVLSQLQQAGGGPNETRSRWETVQKWLRAPRELEDWRVVAVVLARLDDPEASDPVTALAEFLERASFTLDIGRVTLEIPESLEIVPADKAALSIHHPASPGAKAVLKFEPSKVERDAPHRVRTYSFRADEAQRLTYRPGDALWATLPLRDEQQFTWMRCRSSMYQFQCLARPPWLHKAKEEASSGIFAEKVRLTLTPSDGVPRVPDLMPVVRLEP